MVPDCVDQGEGVAVGAESASGLDSAHGVRHRASRQPGGQELAGNSPGRGVCLGQRLSDFAPCGRLCSWWHSLQQGLAHECVPEPVAGLGALDDHRRKRDIEVAVRLILVHTGHGE
jgi:hypothetical protein